MKHIKSVFENFCNCISDDVSYDDILSVFLQLVEKGVSGVTLSADSVAFGDIGLPVKDTFTNVCQQLVFTDKERRWLRENADTLYSDYDRRKKGQFYTPAPLVSVAHSLLESRLGDDFGDKYVVWDCAAGSGNLTKDYTFRELYSSTLDLTEVQRYGKENPNFFQFDFLNDAIDKAPRGLQDAIFGNKPLLFFINPPYNGGGMTVLHGDKNSKVYTEVEKWMTLKGFDVRDLYVQFLCKIILLIREYRLTNVSVGVFEPVTHLVSETYKSFRQLWCSNFYFDRAVLFSASHFTDTSALWGIHFAVWKQGISTQTCEFPHTCIYVSEAGEIVKTGKKIIYNGDDGFRKYPILTHNWFTRKEEYPLQYMPGVNSRFEVVNTVKEGVGKSSYVGKTHLGTLCIDSLVNAKCGYKGFGRAGVLLNTSSIGNVRIVPENFERVCTIFTVANSVYTYLDYVDSKDYLHVPDMGLEGYPQFVNDCVVYALFSNGSCLLSKYGAEYAGKVYNIPNQFFWLTQEKMIDLSKSGDKTRQSMVGGEMRYVQNWLYTGERVLSMEAQTLLCSATKLVEDTFKYREEFDKEHPEVQICNWDAGWCQLRELWKVYAKDTFAQFREQRKALQQSIHSRIRQFGFLRPRSE